MINEKELEELKKQLEKEAADLELRIKDSEKVTDFGSDVESDDYSEEADETEELSNKIGEEHAYKERLADIETALDKISKNEYGKCEKCRNDIELEVLNAVPESKLCKVCKVK